jgi:hypothetical protein
MGKEVLVLGEFVLGSEQAEELSAGAVLEEEVELALILEAHFEFD